MSRSCNLVERSIEDLPEPFNFTRSPGYTRSRSQTFLRDHTNSISIDLCRKLDKTRICRWATSLTIVSLSMTNI